MTDFYYAINLLNYYEGLDESERNYATLEDFFKRIADDISDRGGECTYYRFSNTIPVLKFPTLNNVGNSSIVVWFSLDCSIDDYVKDHIYSNYFTIQNGYYGILHENGSMFGLPMQAYGVGRPPITVGVSYSGGSYKVESYYVGTGSARRPYCDNFLFRVIKVSNYAYQLFCCPRNPTRGSGQAYMPEKTIGVHICNATSEITGKTIPCILRFSPTNDYVNILGESPIFSVYYPASSRDYDGGGGYQYNYYMVSRISFDTYVVDGVYNIRDNELCSYLENTFDENGTPHGILDTNNYSYVDGLVIDNERYVFPFKSSFAQLQNTAMASLLIKK